ncbi:hypothetical protein QZH41_012115 [Actinostola sp. cb2023]|nr:hypothetical protein QZH41_012115 [Actinostola sp. cb2023]
MLIFVQFICVTFTVQSVGSQNSINPRRSKSNLTNGANILLIYFAVLSCPNIQSKSHSDCKMSCLADEHCENHGDDLKCCPTVPGSNCKAECKEPVLSPNGGKICYDFENDRKYTVGDIFPRDGVCCRCELGGIMNCSAVKSCTQGCYYASAYHNDGDFILGNKCRNCSCHNGVVSCKLNPNCTQDKCKYKGKVYKPDHIIRLDHGCKECVCQSKGWICSAITCNAGKFGNKYVHAEFSDKSASAICQDKLCVSASTKM